MFPRDFTCMFSVVGLLRGLRPGALNKEEAWPGDYSGPATHYGNRAERARNIKGRIQPRRQEINTSRVFISVIVARPATCV
ncbi:hypothetical protein NDU88_005326 [Pleurodeles waltl]|uniref:Secreted protein n=1 Tax=Pleurodeles waltl TaxID=8319 RepID=A0AAV7PNB5_PLEWA|nr:hypothetical protein NDU88_005326 [Pleurodeles waltl]